MVMIDDPVIACQGFDQKNAALDFTGLEFIQVDDDEFIMNGTFIIHRDVIGKVPVSPSNIIFVVLCYEDHPYHIEVI